MPDGFPLTLAEVLHAELQHQHPDAAKEFDQKIEAIREQCDWNGRQEHSQVLVPEIYAAIHKLAADPARRRSALCLSGGGVRSATFNLGILQGLARCGLLDKFDYLSTVSGGGFIGSWLTTWIQREEEKNKDNGLKAVVEALKRRPVDSPFEPEPTPVSNLRVYSNYLTPRKGLLSADTGTLVAVYLRNLFLNWLVFLPALMGFLMIPRVWASAVNGAAAYHHFTPLTLGMLGVLLGVVGLLCIVLNLPGGGDKNWPRLTVLAFCVLPLCLLAAFLVLYWIGVNGETSGAGTAISIPRFWEPFIQDLQAVLQAKRPGWPTFLIVGAVLPGLPYIFVYLWRTRVTISEGRLLLSFLLVIVAGAITGLLTYVLVRVGIFSTLASVGGINYRLLYASLSVPLLLGLLTVGGTLMAGFSSRFSGAEDQEWWARSGAWILIFSLVWAGACLVVMFGPLLLVNLPQLIRGSGEWGTVKGAVMTVVGIVSGAFTLLGGSSSKTPANGREGQPPDWKAKLFGVAISAAAAIFLVFLLIVLVWLSDWVLFGVIKPLKATGYFASLPDRVGKHEEFVLASPLWLQVLMTGLFFAIAGVVGWFINTNRFSLHYYWRNRMVRAYQGASNPARDDGNTDREKAPNHFTGFAESDVVRMSEIENKKKLFHIINIALNLAGGNKLEWQDRKCESFSVSPLHCGSYWLGYRESKEYAKGTGQTGISLGTAVAISGAAASPNMGYMMTSPIVRVLMTLFNVRLGFWLGNPGLAGSDPNPKRNHLPTFHRDSPRSSVRPILAEALGMTNDKSPYVYLSDGGHFENLGLYEMILRRCRFIVISDASTDTDYSFDSLAMAIRQIRVDFGVPIEMEMMSFGNDPAEKNGYCATGTIRYSCVDGPDNKEAEKDYDGILIYLKPSLNDSEPRDVLNYHRTSNAFPQDPITDQWFSEAQFESYRMLGSHMIETICKSADTSPDPLDRFARQARLQR